MSEPARRQPESNTQAKKISCVKITTVTIKYPGGKKEKVVDQMIGEDEIQRYSKILNAKTWRKRK